MSALTPADFPAFLRAVHRTDPFPWQQALVGRVLADGVWPDLIDIPTGLGKTIMLDIGLFVAAATAGIPGAARAGRRRCFFVVDRRIVVDEAHEHAVTVATALQKAENVGRDDIVGRVAAALRSYAPRAGGELLPVTRMRGGATWSASWLDRPDRPGIVLGTVDQVGSRLLFRGYGVSDRRKPIDAALVGTDALLLVDEAHLSTALLDTVAAAQARDKLGVPLPGLSVVRLSATGTPGANAFTLDVDAHRADEEASRRLTAGKHLTLITVPAKDCGKTLAEAAVERLEHLRSRAVDVSPAILVVCNTVDRARDVHDNLVRRLSRAKNTDVVCDLLIGRSREVDRRPPTDGALGALNVKRPTARPPAILVATQTVEVGVNIDADALITESASWDALVQRLGRLNRLGVFDRRYPGESAAAAIVVHDGQADGPVYGSARDATVAALNLLIGAEPHGRLDVSPLACRALRDGPLGEPTVRRDDEPAPVLLRPALDAWVQTAPVPQIDPPVAPYLHGFGGGTAPVQIVWRAGLVSSNPLDDPFDDDGTELDPTGAAAMLAHLPPRTAETVDVPWYAARQWMLGQNTDTVSDVDTEPEPGKARPTQVRDRIRVLAQRPVRKAARGYRDGDAEWRWTWIDPEDLRPADVVIAPVERGGLDRYGWAPQSQTTVRDASEAAAFLPSRSRRPLTLRLDNDLADRLGLTGQARDTVREFVAVCSRDDDTVSADGEMTVGDPAWQRLAADIGDALAPQPPAGLGWPENAWDRLRAWWTSGKLSVVDLLDGADAVADTTATVAARLLTGPAGAAVRAQPERDDEDTAASSVGSTGTVTLDRHHAAVRRRSGDIAEALHLPDELRQVIEDAAGWHDWGKAEERFQIMLHGGDHHEAAIATAILAKSGLDPANKQAWHKAARDSGLPRGARHEAWSAALVAAHLAEHPHPGDADLLIHLVAAHHGYARPLARLVIDPQPRTVLALIDGHKATTASDRTVDLDQPTRFTHLNQRYGRWGLALLETIVRCADMTVSEEGS
ncbi:type I-G CRISPR-associated helicase/endonuclease Cas3g [Mangrovihabitans endophyticus]|uniref:HD Cas3-type domain-containing protein n=1 Tax=Mangrovihabitans endophyticus TaxID=1751298 RepID=A0A8J3C5A6_9ACTN|nr:type I-U CRISPR-associated helicase/endonuclease Cas3 [Mangrovihabitans endophyticus]GGL19959.1 hypothetical protein GCM10012284_63160 [Mangrovihabitans endophyticus]